MLVDYNEPNSRTIGSLTLTPGVNQVDKDKWDGLLAAGYKKSVDALIDEGVITIIEDSRVNVALVKKTYDLKILEQWLDEAKGPLKGAIKKQIEVMTQDHNKED